MGEFAEAVLKRNITAYVRLSIVNLSLSRAVWLIRTLGVRADPRLVPFNTLAYCATE